MNDHDKASELVDSEWLLAQLKAWPTRVDQTRTKNIEFLMKSAAALIERQSQAAEALVEALRMGAIPTLAAIRATAATDEWNDAAEHFSDLALDAVQKCNAALRTYQEQINGNR